MGTTKLHKLCYQPGVVMYVDDDNICRDMEVSPEVSVLHIGEQKKPSKTNPPLLFSLDKRKNYVFSGIKELVIEEGTCGVFVANTMFPNVKRVTSHNRQYLSSTHVLYLFRINCVCAFAAVKSTSYNACNAIQVSSFITFQAECV